MPLEDGYVSVLFVTDLSDLIGAAYGLIAELKSHGAVATADIVERTLVKLMDELGTIAIAMSQRGKELVTKEEEDSRVRPDTGLDPAERMVTYFECDAFPAWPGAVGFINKEVIDNSPAHWWWTNELGYSGHIGRELHGYYYDAGWSGATRPMLQTGPAEHPLFGPTGQKGPPMLIQKPIPERRFAQKALDQLDAEWSGAVRNALGWYQVEIAAAMTGAAESLMGFEALMGSL